MAEAISRWLPTAAAQVQSRVGSSGICGGQSGAGAGFLRVLRFPLPIFIPLNNSPLAAKEIVSTIKCMLNKKKKKRSNLYDLERRSTLVLQLKISAV
jgi:hypothetical protein